MLERIKWNLGFLLILGGFFYSYFISINSFNGEIFVDTREILLRSNRYVAAIKKDLKPHDKSFLMSTSPLRILTEARIDHSKETSGAIKIILGHFSTIVAEGEAPTFACQLYDEVLVSYEALKTEDNSNSPSPTMIIKTSCLMDSNDLFHLKAINLNPQEVIKDPPAEGMRMADDGSYSLHFENVENEWPTKWHFKSVQLTDSKRKRASREITRTELSPREQSKLDIAWTH